MKKEFYPAEKPGEKKIVSTRFSGREFSRSEPAALQRWGGGRVYAFWQFAGGVVTTTRIRRRRPCIVLNYLFVIIVARTAINVEKLISKI